MKRALLLLFASACASPPAPGPVEDPAFEMAVAQQVPIDLENARAGQWAVYTVRREGDPVTHPVKYAVVGEEGGGLWIENKVRTDTGEIVVKSKLDRAGKLLEQWVGEPGGIPGQTYPNPRREAPPARRDPSAAQPSTKEERESVTLRGRTYDCVKVTTVLRYPKGGESRMVNWFAKEVPLGPRKYGGLVRRQFGRFTMELAAHGGDAKPELAIPK